MGLGDMLQGQRDAEDAKRYRHLRDSAGNGVIKKLMKKYRADDWDAIVDKDMHRSNRHVPRDHEFDQHGKCKWCPAVQHQTVTGGA